MTGIGILQSGEPWSLYEFYGAVGSINFGNFPTLMNPVLGIKDPKHPKSALTGNSGRFRDPGGNYIPYVDPSQIAISYLQPGDDGIPVSKPYGTCRVLPRLTKLIEAIEPSPRGYQTRTRCPVASYWRKS